jgi:hypothetical protein
MNDDITAYIRCNGATVHVDTTGPFAPRLDSEWGSEQCEGCGEDIAWTAQRFDLKHGETVRCRCGAHYLLYIEHASLR